MRLTPLKPVLPSLTASERSLLRNLRSDLVTLNMFGARYTFDLNSRPGRWRLTSQA